MSDAHEICGPKIFGSEVGEGFGNDGGRKEELISIKCRKQGQIKHLEFKRPSFQNQPGPKF